MKLLLDTHLLLWAASEPHRLSADVRILLEDLSQDCLFSVANLWEVAIKRSLGRRFPG
ncbi:type II toxin-antitoxin system VapC family toxin [Nitrospirillum amazonense]|uniref:type II toxin-antitoxin system VapC family toxin n=1 Tax=Nitrospirillum amazonense TaxID=28077 RepID=UPI0011A6134D|nr:type II toxin-antitoxin system VapC family toxin [Nitrospirillum amazonense]